MGLGAAGTYKKARFRIRLLVAERDLIATAYMLYNDLDL